ncbi:MAG TPA: alpha/beta hydrolase [Alphaproteobacteria bacterium]|nr:alpha/beta hydrolase [Alphaproteobacteria bacterium]
MPIDFDDRDLGETRRVNSVLARMPRLRLHDPIHRNLVQGLTKLGGTLSGVQLRRYGVTAENRTVVASNRAVRVRVLKPAGKAVRGVHIHIHGGGWTTGDARMNDELNAALAAEAGLAIVSVDYRLIPTAPFGAIIEDCETAGRWVLDSYLGELGVTRATIGGESAGAHLAAVTLLGLRETGDRFDHMAGAALIYGCYDLGDSPGRRRPGPETLVLHGPSLAKLADKATGLDAAARRDPRVSPLLADLSGLPPALFIVGDKDPLQEDSERMHAKWMAQSGNSELITVPEAPHGFNHMPTRAAVKTNAYVRSWLAARF